MARKSIVELNTDAATKLPDNTNQEIGPEDVRQMFQDFLDTMAPSYGGLQISTRVQAVTTTPTPMVFMTSIISLPPQWVVDPAAGTLSRSLAGVAKLNSRFTVCGTVTGPSGADLKISLYDHTTELAWIQIVACRGTGNRCGFAFTALDAMEADASYTLKISSSNQNNYTFENVLFVGENVAIRDFQTGTGLFRALAYNEGV